MTGSAFQRWTLWWHVFSVEKGGGLEEGGLEIHFGGGDADFFRCFFCVFSSSVSGGSFFLVLFSFLGAFGCRRGVIFGHCWLKKRFFHEKVAPSFLHTFTAFWLDFEGLGPSGGFKKQEKTAPGKSCFFGLKRKVPKSVFYDFRVSFGVDFGALGRPKMVH